MTPPKVLIADAISQRGVDELSRDCAIEAVLKTGLSEKELVDLIPDFSALVVRSQTKVTADVLNAGTKLRVVGRAGVGVDNVDVETATRRGIIVLNAPGGNTVSTAEHAFSLLLSAARKIPQADANVRSKNWDKKNFEGVELYNKTLGVIGPHLRFGEKLGRFLSQLAPKRAETLNINYSGKVNEVDTTAITRSILKGFLQIAGGSEVNEVNAPSFAESLGLKVSESRLSAPGDYTDMLELSAAGEGKTVSVGGAFFGATPRIISINSRPVEARPHGVVLVLENTDRPGMVGRV